MPFPMLLQLLLLRGIYEMLPIQLGPIDMYISICVSLGSFSDEARRLDCLCWVQNIHKLTKKAAAAIPTPAARIEVILDELICPGFEILP